MKSSRSWKTRVKRKDALGAFLFFFGIATVTATVWTRDSAVGGIVALILVALGLRTMFARSETDAGRASGRILDRLVTVNKPDAKISRTE